MSKRRVDTEAPTFPKKTSGPEEIRRYIRHVLQTKHDMTSHEAAEIASRWPIGRGNDFLSGSRDEFVRLFGADIGPYLRSSVHEDEYDGWKRSSSGQAYFYMTVSCILVAIYFVACAVRDTSVRSSAFYVLAALSVLAFPQAPCAFTMPGDMGDGIFVLSFLASIVLAFAWAFWLSPDGGKRYA